MEDRIIKYLSSDRHICSTSHIARHCIFKDQYDRNEAALNNRVKIWPGRDSVQRAYYQLRKLANAGKIRQIGRGAWAANLKDFTPSPTVETPQNTGGNAGEGVGEQQKQQPC